MTGPAHSRQRPPRLAGALTRALVLAVAVMLVGLPSAARAQAAPEAVGGMVHAGATVDTEANGDADAEAEEAPTVGQSGRPLPRFASLGSDHINMRTGPGTRYPVTWVYKRRGLPVEVLAETSDWRHVRDPDDAEGWVHKIMLSNSTRTAILKGPGRQTLLRRPEPDARGVAEVEPGVIVKLLQCPNDSAHCRVEAGRFQGWLPRQYLWGVYPSEYVD